MPAYLNTLRDEILTLTGNTWTDAKPNGVYRGRELALIDFDGKAQAGELPLAIIDMDAAPSGDWGLGNRVDACRVEIYYVCTDATSPDALITKLEALRTALWPDNGSEALSTGQVMEYPLISDSISLEVNRYLLNRQLPYFAGAVIVQVLVGVTP